MPCLLPRSSTKEVLPFLHDLGVIAGDARVGDDEILVHFAADRERSAIQNDVLLLASLHENKGGKHSGSGAVMAV